MIKKNSLLKTVGLAFLIALFISCSGVKKVSVDDCKRQTERIFLYVKSSDYKELLKLLNSEPQIKSRKISETDLELNFRSLNSYLQKYSTNDFYYLNSKEGSNVPSIFNLTIEVKNKRTNLSVLKCIYFHGRDGDFYELDKFYNNLDTVRIKASQVPLPPSLKKN